MGMKLHRNRRVFRDRHPIRRALIWGITALVVIAIGFFGAQYLAEHPLKNDTDNHVSSQPDTPSQPDNPVSQPNDTETPPPAPPSTTEMRGFYLPTTVLHNDSTLKETLRAAAAADFTHVIFDLKDNDGTLHFRSESSRAVKVNAYADNAWSMDDIKILFTTIREAGLTPIARLYAFMDTKAARALPLARVTHASNAGWVWYDDDPKEGGRAWLNPYADEAQLYIIELAKELRDSGIAGIILDGVQFPQRTSAANFGQSTLNRDDVLTGFINKIRTVLGDDCPVTLSCSANSALGTDTVVYGGNPLTFTPAIASPLLLTGSMPARITVGTETLENTPDTLGATVRALTNQMALRIKVMAADKQPILMPWLQAYEYTATQIKSAMQGCIDSGADSFVLYNPAGTYDFTALK